MLAIEITRPGDPEVLALADLPVPDWKTGEVLIKVAASGVNRPDILQRKGLYPAPQGASSIPGLELSGSIIEGDFSGYNPFNLQSGDAICALVAGGGYAEYAVAPLSQCLPVPKGIGLTEAAAFPETFFTVWSNVFDRARLGCNDAGTPESLLVHGGSSGIGVAAIQIAHALGHPVFATAGSEEKCRACEALGAKAINYRTQDFVERVRFFTGGRGVDVVLDMVAGDYLPRNMDVLADNGRLAVIASLGGPMTTLDVRTLMRRRLTITGSTLRSQSIGFKAAIARQLYDVVWPLVESGKIKPVIHQIFPAEEAASAHTLMESGTHIGKLLLQW